MNRSDKCLLMILLIIISSSIIMMFFLRSHEPKNALVYYKDNLVLTIDLSNNGTKTYTVNGELGDVIIEKNGDKVRVINETSPNHICSNQGYIKENYEVLVCLPNKVIIKIDSKDSIDTIVK